MDVFAVLLSLALLLFVAYRGWSVIFWAPVLALLAAALSGLPVLPAYTELFMGQGALYFKKFFPIFLLGAVFGKLMETSGMAASIARKIFATLGPQNAILSTVLAASILTYGGVSMFVVVFAVYPFAAALFKEAGIPKRLLPASIFLGAFTFTMDSLPGTPQIQNLIPANFFGTNLYAAPVLGLIISVIIFTLGMLWLRYRMRQAFARGEGYGEHTLNEMPTSDDSKLPPWTLSALPLISVLIINLVGSHYMEGWSISVLDPIKNLQIPPPLMVDKISNIYSTWALLTGLVFAILLTIILRFRSMVPNGLVTTSISAGALGSLLAIVNTASEVGYGNVIASLPGFTHVAKALFAVEHFGGTLLSECLTINVLAGITGSASGGLSIALSLFKDHWMQLAAQNHIPIEVLHRVAAIAAGGMDTLPHNGAVITLLAVCGMTHKQSYPDIFAMTLMKVLMSFLAVLLFRLFGIV